MTAPSPHRAKSGDRARWRDLVGRRLPEAARARRDWPVRLDHCFARILLDHACGGPWRESVAPPAHANLEPDRLAAAVTLGEAVLAGRADLAALNRRSLIWRGKAPPRPFPQRLAGEGFVLRPWRPADDAPFAALNADPEVMRHCPAPRTEVRSRAEARAHHRRFQADGFGAWAVEAPLDGAAPAFVGFVGCRTLGRALPFAPVPWSAVEIGWRLARGAWGRGIASRAARLALADAIGRCGLHEAVAFAAAGNIPSRRVMERIGMKRQPDFEHPALPDGHVQRPHVLYRLRAAEFSGAAA